MTAQTATFERQLLYSLVRQKEAALNRLITRKFAPLCDQDYTRAKPHEQRAHLFSVRAGRGAITRACMYAHCRPVTWLVEATHARACTRSNKRIQSVD